MNALVRWLKFNAVGAMGMVVQLGSLAGLARLLPGHALVASALAVELAVLHNFCWHVRFTWRDRKGAWAPQLVRFQMANGLVSVVGNVVLMRAMVGHVPLLAANGIAIVVCSLVNFALSSGWAFA
jgi:putative flippase GtrA